MALAAKNLFVELDKGLLSFCPEHFLLELVIAHGLQLLQNMAVYCHWDVFVILLESLQLLMVHFHVDLGAKQWLVLKICFAAIHLGEAPNSGVSSLGILGLVCVLVPQDHLVLLHGQLARISSILARFQTSGKSFIVSSRCCLSQV